MEETEKSTLSNILKFTQMLLNHDLNSSNLTAVPAFFFFWFQTLVNIHIPHSFLFVCLFCFLKLFIIYLWLCWVFVSVRGLSLVAASGGHSSSPCAGLSLSRPLLLRSTGSRRTGLAVVAHGPSCSAACGIFPDQGSNPCPLHLQADSQPLRHQGSPSACILNHHFPLYWSMPLKGRRIWFSNVMARSAGFLRIQVMVRRNGVNGRY